MWHCGSTRWISGAWTRSSKPWRHVDRQALELGRTQNRRANADEYEKDSISDFVLWKARREAYHVLEQKVAQRVWGRNSERANDPARSGARSTGEKV